MNDSELIYKIIDIVLKLAAIGMGSYWTYQEIKRYSLDHQWIQFDIDANLFKLPSAIETTSFTWNKKGQKIETGSQRHNHAVEFVLKFSNKGKTRAKIFNIQVMINTMKPKEETEFGEEDGRLKTDRLFTSGNIVPKSIGHYYIEPNVDQTITYLALINEPKDLLQVKGEFSLEQERIFPNKKKGQKGLDPHLAMRTFQIDSEGKLIKIG
jgi:hypothetical protein